MEKRRKANVQINISKNIHQFEPLQLSDFSRKYICTCTVACI